MAGPGSVAGQELNKRHPKQGPQSRPPATAAREAAAVITASKLIFIFDKTENKTRSRQAGRRATRRGDRAEAHLLPQPN